MARSKGSKDLPEAKRGALIEGNTVRLQGSIVMYIA